MSTTLGCSCKLGSLVSHKTPLSANTLLYSVCLQDSHNPLPIFLLFQQLGGRNSFKPNNTLQPPCYPIPVKSMRSLFNCHLIESTRISVWVLLASQGRWFQGFLGRRAPEDTSSYRSCFSCQKTVALSATRFMTEWRESIYIPLRFKQMLPPQENLKMQIYSPCQTFICNRAVMSAYLRKCLSGNRHFCQGFELLEISCCKAS